MLIFKDGKLFLQKQKYSEKILKHFDWLVDYIPESIRKIVSGFKEKVVSLFNTNTPEQMLHGSGKKLSKPKTQKQSEENLFIHKNENKKEKKENRN